MIYLASPYSHPDPAVREERFREVSRYAAHLIRRGEVVFCPIAHSHPIEVHADDVLPGGWGFWSRIDTPFLAAADEVRVLRLPGWTASEGVRGEVDLALRLGIPVTYVDPVPAPVPVGDGDG